MSDRSSKYTHRPFKDLKGMLKHRKIAIAPNVAQKPIPKAAVSVGAVQNEDELFFKAMADVTPIHYNKISAKAKPVSTNPASKTDEDEEARAALNLLIRKGHGFLVSQTPEYMEAANPGASTEILRRLHQGRYSIEDFVDLHGLRVPEAEQVFEGFLRRSIRHNLRAVLIVHGRGLTSPKEPVLKNKVYTWLTRGSLRKWVIAFTSARSCDGGTGATYVLLRRRPLTKSQRRKNNTALTKKSF